MGAKLSRRKSEAAAAEGAVVEAPAQDQPATPKALAVSESSEQNLSRAEATLEAKPKVAPLTAADSRPVPGALEVITQSAEETMSAICQQITRPVEDVLNKSKVAVEAMMAAVGMKDDMTEQPAGAGPDPEQKPETLVDLSEENTPRMISSTPKLPEDLAYLPSDLLSSQSIPEVLLSEPVAAAIADDCVPVAMKKEENPSHSDIHAPPESKEMQACMKQDAEPPATTSSEPLNYEVSVDQSTLNSDPLVDLGDMEQGVSTAVNTINDLI